MVAEVAGLDSGWNERDTASSQVRLGVLPQGLLLTMALDLLLALDGLSFAALVSVIHAAVHSTVSTFQCFPVLLDA